MATVNSRFNQAKAGLPQTNFPISGNREMWREIGEIPAEITQSANLSLYLQSLVVFLHSLKDAAGTDVPYLTFDSDQQFPLFSRPENFAKQFRAFFFESNLHRVPTSYGLFRDQRGPVFIERSATHDVR